MGLFGTLLEKGEQAIDWTFESPKKALGMPGRVMSWARERIRNAMLESKTVENTGARIDMWLSPVSKAVSRFFGAGKVEVAEDRTLARLREKWRKKADDITSASRRINLPTGEEAVRDEERTKKVFSEELNRESTIDMPEITPTERTVLTYINQRINHYRTSPFTLLSSTHPLTEIAQKRARYLNVSPSIKELSDVQLLRYPPLEQGSDPQREDGENAFRSTVTGSIRRSIINKNPRLNLNSDERRRTLEPPKIQGERYEVLLEEPDKAFQERCIEVQQKRKQLIAEPFHITLKMGQEGFPIDGNPYYIYRALAAKYPKLFNNVDRNQIAMGIHRSGDQISIAGFVTKNRPVTPEPLTFRDPPRRFDENYYNRNINRVGNTNHIDWLTQQPDFNNKYNVFNYSKIHKLVHSLQQRELNIKIDDIKIQPNDPVARRLFGNTLEPEYTNTLQFSITINGEKNQVTMFNGVEVLQLNEESMIYKAKEDNGEVQTPYVNVDELLMILETLSKEDIQTNIKSPRNP